MPLRGSQHDAPDPLDDAGAGPSLVDLAMFVLAALVRRRWVALGVLALGVGAVFGYFNLKVPIYRAETRILAQRQEALPSLVRPQGLEDAPTRSAWDLVHRRENLVAVIEEAKLLDDPPPGSLRERMRLRLGTPADVGEDDVLELLVLQLHRAIHVDADEGTLTISVDWTDPEQSYRIVESALQNFLEARHVQEVSAIDEFIAVLEARTVALREQLEATITEVRREARSTGGSSVSVRPGGRAGASGEEVARVRSMLDAKQRAIQDVEEFRRRRLADLQAQLDQMRGMYSDAYPGIQILRQDIAALSRESPQIATLRDEERQLQHEYGRLTKSVGSSLPAVTSSTQPRSASDVEQDERVRDARLRYHQMAERLSAAQLDVDAARAAFKHRYNMVWPPQVPKEPISPNRVKIFGGGLIAALALAIGAATGVELLAGRAIQRWQLEKQLRLPVIAEVRRR